MGIMKETLNINGTLFVQTVETCLRLATSLTELWILQYSLYYSYRPTI